MSQKPSYYRSEFEHWFGTMYDFIMKVFTFGFEHKVRRNIFSYIQNNPQTIVDLACGTGSLTLILHEKFPTARIYGFDLSEKMLNKAKLKSKDQNIKFKTQNIEHLDLPDNSVDLVTISFGIHEVPEAARRNVIKESYRILKKQGIFLIFDFAKNDNFVQKYLMRPFFNLFEPYVQSFISKSGQELLSPFGFKEIKEYRHHFITRYIKALKT